MDTRNRRAGRKLGESIFALAQNTSPWRQARTTGYVPARPCANPRFPVAMRQIPLFISALDKSCRPATRGRVDAVVVDADGARTVPVEELDLSYRHSGARARRRSWRRFASSSCRGRSRRSRRRWPSCSRSARRPSRRRSARSAASSRTRRASAAPGALIEACGLKGHADRRRASSRSATRTSSRTPAARRRPTRSR